MGRAAFVLHIKPDRVDEYVTAHQAVWPDLLDALSVAGVRNYSIFLHGNQAFGYFEADDPQGALAAVGPTDANVRWQEHMADLFEQRMGDDGPAMLPEVFHLD